MTSDPETHVLNNRCDEWEDPFLAARAVADRHRGDVVLLPDGRLAVSRHDRVIEGTVLPSERFAAPTAVRRREEEEVVRRLVRQQTRWLTTLIPVDRARLRGWSIPADAPEGWYLHTARSPGFGDHLHAIVALLDQTGLYHVYLCRYICHHDGIDSVMPLEQVLGRLDTVTGHGIHVYTTSEGLVLCLSRRSLGGLPGFDGALARTVLWLEGAAHAVRGRAFPYAR